MPRLHDPAVRAAMKARVKSLRADSPRKWGKMTSDQMLWHVSQALDLCLGQLNADYEKPPVPMPAWMARIFVLNLPWPKGAPTLQITKPGASHNFEEQRARCLTLIDAFAARPIDGAWPRHPALGKMSGDQYSRLQAKHLNHHLTQFSA